MPVNESHTTYIQYIYAFLAVKTWKSLKNGIGPTQELF